MLSILAFLGSGVGLGLLKFALEAFLESRRQKSDQEHRERLALGNQLVEYTNAIHGKSHEVDLEKESEWEICLFGKKLFSYKGSHKKETVIYTLAAWADSIVFVSLAFTVCWICLIWADSPNILIWTNDPNAKPTNVGFLWKLFELNFSNSKVQAITTGGAAFILSHPIASVIGYKLVGTMARRK
jgi:hypothetical protein